MKDAGANGKEPAGVEADKPQDGQSAPAGPSRPDERTPASASKAALKRRASSDGRTPKRKEEATKVVCKEPSSFALKCKLACWEMGANWHGRAADQLIWRKIGAISIADPQYTADSWYRGFKMCHAWVRINSNCHS